MKKKKLLVTCLAGVLLLYTCAYGWVRYDRHIVHSVVVDAYGNYSDHSVVAGDAVFAGGWFNSVLSTLLTPLRGIECCYWYWRHPEGTELSETHRRNRRLGLNRFSHMQDQTEMTIDEFWEIIGRVKLTSDDIDERKASLRDELMRLTPNEVASFATHFGELIRQAYSWDLWGAVYLMMGGCSDDGLWDFRSALISLGRESFQTILSDPDAIADLPRHEISNLHAEGFQYIDGEVYRELTGREMTSEGTVPAEPSGTKWDEGDVEFFRMNYPKVFAKYPWLDAGE